MPASTPGCPRSDGTVKVEWNDRSVPLPPAGQVWASDGHMVWLIWANGELIPASATAVKFWTAALIPSPPLAPAMN